jgi:DNA-binding CsgD family transcriptional regulator
VVLLDSANHILLSDEPAWPAFLAEVRGFLGTSPAPVAGRLERLSDREYEVLELTATGMTNDAIAERLIISVRTVERHLSNVYAKLGVSGKAGRAAAALVAREIDADDVLTEIAVPVLVTHGRADRIVQPSMAEHVLDVCGSAEASWYDGVGHMPFLEAPARFDHELGQFVARVH